jgi:hypothetical protein
MRAVFIASTCCLLVACSESSSNVFTPEDAALLDVTALDAVEDSNDAKPPRDTAAEPDRASPPVRDVPAVDTPLFVDSGARTPVCGACTGPADCGADGVCVQVATGSRACLPRCNPDVPVCPGRLRCVRDVALADVAVCAPVGGVCCIDGDGDGYGVGVGCRGADCDDNDPMRTGMSTETCNGRDDDCDGMIDEGCTCTPAATRMCYPGDPATAGRGRCRAGTERCADDGSAWGACMDAVTPAASETCGNGMDDDCDGMTDEGCAMGECSSGTSSVRWNLPAGTTGGPDCITRGGGYCEGVAYCSGTSCSTRTPSGCGEPHCGTLRCNDGSYSRERYCTVIATCTGGTITATGFTW